MSWDVQLSFFVNLLKGSRQHFLQQKPNLDAFHTDGLWIRSTAILNYTAAAVECCFLSNADVWSGDVSVQTPTVVCRTVILFLVLILCIILVLLTVGCFGELLPHQIRYQLTTDWWDGPMIKEKMWRDHNVLQMWSILQSHQHHREGGGHNDPGLTCFIIVTKWRKG